MTDGSSDADGRQPQSRWPDPTEIEHGGRARHRRRRFSPTKNTSAAFSSSSKTSADGRQNIEYVSETRVMLTYELPLNEIVLDFYDQA